MTGRSSVTVSPSRVRISRSTPCVDGCCGPMLTTMCSSPDCSPVRRPPRRPRPSPGRRRCRRGPRRSRQSLASRGRGSTAGLMVSRAVIVRPPLVRRRHGRAAVLDRDAAERVVLPLRVAPPVVGHLDPGQRGMAVEDDAEEVPGLPLVPVAGGVDVDQRRDVRVGVRRGDLEPDPPVVRDRQQVVHRVQLARRCRPGSARRRRPGTSRRPATARRAASTPPPPGARGARRGSARRWRRRPALPRRRS